VGRVSSASALRSLRRARFPRYNSHHCGVKANGAVSGQDVVGPWADAQTWVRALWTAELAQAVDDFAAAAARAEKAVRRLTVRSALVVLVAQDPFHGCTVQKQVVTPPRGHAR